MRNFFLMKKFSYGLLPLALTFSILFINIKCEAQDDELEDIAGHWEVGVTGGANTFLGDLGGNRGKGQTFIKDFNAPTTRPLIGAFVDYFPYSWLAVRLAFNYTNVTGADSLIKNSNDYERWRYYRNLSFRSRIFEGSINADVYPVMIFDKNVEIHKVSPYIGFGLGLFHFNPQTYYQGKWVDLRPLHTEGEGFTGSNTYTDARTGKITSIPYPKQYSLLGVYIPVTLGVKFYFDNTFAISAGVTFRHTFTDYIDDVHGYYVNQSAFDQNLSPTQAALAKQLSGYSQSRTPWKVHPALSRADATQNDSYTNIFLTLSVRFGNGPKFYYGG